MTIGMTQATYETDELLDQYLDFHYGPDHFGVANYPARCAELCVEALSERTDLRSLDGPIRVLELGCACGRTAFELARHFEHVEAIDLSARFIEAARTLQETGQHRYSLTTQGELRENYSADLARLKLADTAGRVKFQVGDACVAKSGQRHDLIFAGNLLDRLSAPAAFLDSMQERLNDDGLFVISSPYTLLEAFTERTDWIGGFIDADGEPRTVLDGMHAILDEHFERQDNPVDVHFVIRETARKFQHSVAEMTVWRRRRRPA
ncbi:putative 4-mercaptohistidine N1-methyltransferase [Allohahella marinimesophila]|uniref:4-mercaptohistidine N1-methyltransferase n=1 Tax=Allohahella marinimesophila TaxID=1054972 RepID=A0ABP7NI97_9GAMM